MRTRASSLACWQRACCRELPLQRHLFQATLASAAAAAGGATRAAQRGGDDDPWLVPLPNRLQEAVQEVLAGRGGTGGELRPLALGETGGFCSEAFREGLRAFLGKQVLRGGGGVCVLGVRDRCI